jgi:hypothetical protein
MVHPGRRRRFLNFRPTEKPAPGAPRKQPAGFIPSVPPLAFRRNFCQANSVLTAAAPAANGIQREDRQTAIN